MSIRVFGYSFVYPSSGGQPPKNMKIQSLMANIALTAMLTFLPLSSGSIQMLEKLAISITLVDFATKLLDKEDQP
jgi:hypothetical protein